MEETTHHNGRDNTSQWKKQQGEGAVEIARKRGGETVR